MSRLFENANQIRAGDIHAPTVHGNYNDFRVSAPPTDGVSQLLLPHIAAGALHNSDDRCDVPKCHPDTRVAVQDSILGWATRTSASANSEAGLTSDIMWVTGPAGTGKTAIAGSIAEACHNQGSMAGAFFFSSFSGDIRRWSKRYFVATLAYQIMRLQCFQDASREVELAIRQDPAIFEKRLGDQLETLILRPLREWAARRLAESESSEPIPRVIIVDGLDECEAGSPPHSATIGDATQKNEGEELEQRRRRNEESQAEILNVLKQLVSDPACPFRVIVFSRPETVIRHFFSDLGTDTYREIFLDNKYDPDTDIELFLTAKFAEIRFRHPDLPASWPSKEIIKLLVALASGQFIYAATVLRFVDGPSRNPYLLLEQLLKNNTCADTKGPSPLAPLDQLYTSIMSRCHDPELLATWISIWDSYGGVVIVDNFYWEPSYLPRSAFFWRMLLSTYPGEADSLLDNLASLIAIPPRDDLEAEFHFYHRTFQEFLSDPRRNGLPIVKKGRAAALYSKHVPLKY
ncbi:hypothetical protein D9611_013856 [Ephemerocybe angulata]|uniref:Nephrocystin 3-like N-terminal domain-containing protein n=1 Tax=Ephemerocybe angulata TaxID=980116 RepID=A0A8H5BT08_9AGAR|nr:hypothetical protein D9611_013856 [Tulosesus angulatus]